jgi:hypothetical protein
MMMCAMVTDRVGDASRAVAGVEWAGDPAGPVKELLPAVYREISVYAVMPQREYV